VNGQRLRGPETEAIPLHYKNSKRYIDVIPLKGPPCKLMLVAQG
jgi:hypothetical protein